MNLLQNPLPGSMQKSATTDIYTDLNGLQNLKSSARKNAQTALPEVARQFEAVMISMMIKNLRKTGMEDPIFKSQAMDSYRDMYDQQLSMELSKGRGIGLAESIVQQLQHQVGQTPGAESQQKMALKLPERRQFPDLYSSKEKVPAQVNNAQVNVEAIAENITSEFKTPEQFVEKLWPLAEKTAKKLGVTPEIILSQAALETGWGKYVIAQDDNSSFNLFNIKADLNWPGKKMAKVSMEFIHGKPVQQKSDFRAYSSFAQSFDDYANLIKNNPRYSESFKEIDQEIKKSEQYLHDNNYIKALHKAGYATDPDYSNKVMRVLERVNRINT